jgi:hypothetical protein
VDGLGLPPSWVYLKIGYAQNPMVYHHFPIRHQNSVTIDNPIVDVQLTLLTYRTMWQLQCHKPTIWGCNSSVDLLKFPGCNPSRPSRSCGVPATQKSISCEHRIPPALTAPATWDGKPGKKTLSVGVTMIRFNTIYFLFSTIYLYNMLYMCIYV